MQSVTGTFYIHLTYSEFRYIHTHIRTYVAFLFRTDMCTSEKHLLVHFSCTVPYPCIIILIFGSIWISSFIFTPQVNLSLNLQSFNRKKSSFPKYIPFLGIILQLQPINFCFLFTFSYFSPIESISIRFVLIYNHNICRKKMTFNLC